MNKATNITFAILGGGIAGLTTAISLKKLGIEAFVFEAADEFKPLGAGITLAVNAMKAYDHLGMLDEISQSGKAFSDLYLLTQTGKIISKTSTPLDSRLTNIAIHRGALHQLLLNQLDSKQIINGKRSVGIETTPNDYRVTFEDGTSIQSKYLIVAEGIHSPIRQQLLPDARKRYSGSTCWRGIADNKKLKIERTSETWGRNGRFGIVPLKDDQVYWFAVLNAPEQSKAMSHFTTADLIKNFDAYHSPIHEVLQATPRDKVIHGDLHDLRPIHQFAFGNIVLIGDSAHATTPNMGQGACMAIEDAVTLAECLKQNSMVSEAFRAFEKKRIPRTHYIVNQSWKMGKAAQWENPLAISVRNTVFRMVPASFYEKQIRDLYHFEP